MAFGDVWLLNGDGEVVYSGPRLARAVFSWGRDVQSGVGDEGG